MRSRALLPVLIIILVVLVIVLDIQRRGTKAELEHLSVRLEQLQGNSEASQERARQIVERVRDHIEIPADITPTVASIVDVEKLRAQNSFYDNAENGDYLIVTPTRAILYDTDRNIIIDVVPVLIQPNASQAAE